MNEAEYFAVGENALTISFGKEISLAVNRKVRELAKIIECEPFFGLIEIVPAYASLTVFYDLIKVRRHFPDAPTAFAAVKNIVASLAENITETQIEKSRLIEIPFDCRDRYAPDLEFVAAAKNLSKTEIIEIFTAKIYTVFMLGFLPGFAYMGEVDERIAVPRRENPRLRVEKGSVGIAGKQTGIYPLASPGGWRIIGRTDVAFFTPEAENPTFLRTGDEVKFTAT